MRTLLTALLTLLAVSATADDRFTFLGLIVDSSITSGDTYAWCDADSAVVGGTTCLAMTDITVVALGVAPQLLTATTECGRATLQVAGVNQSSFEVVFGNGNIPVEGNCTLSDTDNDKSSGANEACVRRGSVDVDAGETYALVLLDMASTPPAPCNATLTVFDHAEVSMEFVNR